jgi:serine/threonine-protein kinase RsbW
MHYSQIDLYTSTNRMKAYLILASRLQEVTTFMRRLLRLLTTYDFEINDVFSIQLAVEEALVNAIKHGNGMDRSKHVHVSIALGRKEFRIRIRDEGKGFDSSEVPDPTTPENLERSSGRGLLLMRHYMNEVRYNGKGNAVTLARQRSSAL